MSKINDKLSFGIKKDFLYLQVIKIKQVMITFILKTIISIILWVLVAKVFLYFGKKIFKD